MVYTTDHEKHEGRALITRGKDEVITIKTEPNLPHNYALWTEFDGDDVWIGTSKGLAHGIGEGYFPGLRAESKAATSEDSPSTTSH